MARKKRLAFACKLLKEFGRGEWIRTTDLLVPNLIQNFSGIALES